MHRHNTLLNLMSTFIRAIARRFSRYEFRTFVLATKWLMMTTVVVTCFPSAYSAVPGTLTKLSANGQELSASASSWACVRDDDSGLIWEVKTTDGTIRDKSQALTSSYGVPALLADLAGRQLCGRTDWRMPSNAEVFTLARFGGPAASVGALKVDIGYFPEWLAGAYFAGYPFGGGPDRYPGIIFFNSGTGLLQYTWPYLGCCDTLLGRMVAGGDLAQSRVASIGADGEYVYDPLSDVTMRRCAVGTTFVAAIPSGSCQGTPTQMPFSAAQSSATPTWRLPTIHEAFRLSGFGGGYPQWSSTTYEGNAAQIVRMSSQAWNLPEVVNVTDSSATSLAQLVAAGRLISELTIAAAGDGTGTVSTDYGGMTCSRSANTTSGYCVASFSQTRIVTLTATAANGQFFLGWSGACSGNQGTCVLTMTQNRSAGATFSTAPPSTVSSFAPSTARLDVPQTFTISGTNFVAGSTTVAIDDCPLVAGTANAPNPVISPTQITATCKPNLPGLKRLLINGQAVANRTVFVDHPTRVGNPVTRGVPAINGVSLFNGNYFYEVTDMSVPGKGLPFTLRRSYNSYYWREEAKRGSVDNYRPWRFNWDMELGYVAGSGNKQLYVEQADGSGRNFFQDTDNQWYPIDQGSFDQVKFDDPSVGFVTFYERNGIKYIFESPTASVPGRLKLVRDHAGNTLTVAHDAATRRIASVTDTVGRVFDFTYYPTGDTAGRDGLLRRVNYSAASALYPAGWFVEYDWIADNPPENANASPRLRARLASVRDVRGQLATYAYVSKAAQPSAGLSSRVFLASHTDARGNAAIKLSYSIDVFGNWGVDRIENAATNFWNFQYCAKQANNSCGSVTTAVSFENRALPPSASGLGNRTARFDAAGRPTAYVDGRGNVTTITPQPIASLTTAKQYNLAGLTAAQQSQLGNSTGYAYTPDNAGNLATRTDPLGNAWGATYSAANATQLAAKNLHLPSATTTPLGLSRSLEFDSATGVNTKRTDPGGAFKTFTPNSAGQVTQSIDQRSSATDYQYVAGADNLGGAQVSRITYPADAVNVRATEEFKYDLLGRVRWFKDKLGAITETEYDEGGNVIATKRRRSAGGTLERTVRQGFDASGNLVWRVDARGQRTEFVYDAANRQTSMIVKANASLGIASDIVTTNTFDVAGRLWKTTNPNSHTVTTVVDASGNTRSRSNQLNDTTTYEYDADNRLTSITDPEGRITKYEYDAAGRLRFTETNAGATIMRTERRYDADGRLTHQIEARAVNGRKNETQYTYHDASSSCAVCKGRLWKVFDATQTGLPSPQPSSVTVYDAAGNATAITDPRGNTTNITYDKLNREILRTFPGTSNTAGVEYNLAGQVLRTLANGVEKLKYTYDEYGQLMRTDFAGGFAAFVYDDNGNRVMMTDHLGTSTYAYDGLNRLIKMTDVWGKTLEFTYDGAGNRTGIRYPNGKWVYYDYDAAERMKTVRPWWATTAAQYTAYTLDKSGRVTNASLGNGASVASQYDTAGRLTLLENKSPNVPGGFISRHALTLDDNGNWASADQTLPLQYQPAGNTSATFTHDASNRIATVSIPNTVGTIAYDTAGRMIRYISGTVNQGFDGRDLLVSTDGGTRGSLFNGDGHRVARTINGTAIPNIDRKYVIDPNPQSPTLWNILTETDAYGQDVTNFVYGYGLLAQVNTADQVDYFHFDPTGNTLALTNGKSEISATFAYSPYGESQSRTTDTTTPFMYSGKHGVLTDTRTGVVHMRARAYRPEIGRFVSLDSIVGQPFTAQTMNRYAYALGDPFGRVDPTGLESENNAEQALGLVGLSVDAVGSLTSKFSVFSASEGTFWGKAKFLWSERSILRYATDTQYRDGLARLGNTFDKAKFAGNTLVVANAVVSLKNISIQFLDGETERALVSTGKFSVSTFIGLASGAGVAALCASGVGTVVCIAGGALVIGGGVVADATLSERTADWWVHSWEAIGGGTYTIVNDARTGAYGDRLYDWNCTDPSHRKLRWLSCGVTKKD